MTLARLRRNSLLWAIVVGAVALLAVVWTILVRGCTGDATFPVVSTVLGVVGALFGAISLLKISREALGFHLAQMRATHHVMRAEALSMDADILSAALTTGAGPNATTEQRLEALERKFEDLSKAVESVDRLTQDIEGLRTQLKAAEERAKQALEDAKREARDTEKRQFPWLALGLFLAVLGMALANVGNVLAGCR